MKLRLIKSKIFDLLKKFKSFEENKDENEKESSALDSLGLKPKPAI